MKLSCKTLHKPGSSDMDPTAPTTALNRDGKMFRAGKGTVHWIQNRNVTV